VSASTVVSYENRRSGRGKVVSASDRALDAAAFLRRAELVYSLNSRLRYRAAARDLGVGALRLFARDVGGKMSQPAIEIGDALLARVFPRRSSVGERMVSVGRCSRCGRASA